MLKNRDAPPPSKQSQPGFLQFLAADPNSFATIASWESGNSLPNCPRNQCGCDVMATESDHVD